jgi:uncharacterized protein (TIGR03083 family)
MTMIDVATIESLSHPEAMSLQARELEHTLASLRSLDDIAWSAATDCPAWDVRAMYQHVLGACESGASLRENIHQLRRARSFRKKNGGPLEAALSAVQVHERMDLSPRQIVERLAAVAPKTVRGRKRTPALVETWNMGYLIDTIYLRDLWMHRIDVSHALGRSLELNTDHDARIIADVVAEWARRHSQPFVLVLTGPVGATYTQNPDVPESEHISLDAIEFCRTLAGRAPAAGLLTTVVPF